MRVNLEIAAAFSYLGSVPYRTIACIEAHEIPAASASFAIAPCPC